MQFSGKRPIRVGDSTTHGGIVLPTSHEFSIFGRQVVTIGDRVMCPNCGITSIVEGDTQSLLDGANIALHGHRTSCGASLISSLAG
ncbi:PAAR domain-containing protein [Caballeronia sp. SL2Y3]|uniref:PAAR domain-containing protein n=1 Tax=Caballeronia sp. SL2Y3 TaxID=2878151 RepID=UPI001FD482E6|nr:PAAR domain-containing protein [Caballeronia sp. SL2Y3]